LSPVTSSAASPTIEGPYVGLTNFTEADAELFFGRDDESAVIIGNLRAARLTLLYAQSGVGKSSVLRAGVVASLRDYGGRELEARGSPRLLPVMFSSWSREPVPALIGAIAEAAAPYWPDGMASELPADDLEAAIAAASEALDATLLLILDQFEEHFLYPEDMAEGTGLADQVARCVNNPELRVNFLISIREDAYAHVGDLFRGKITNVYRNFLHLDFLDLAGAREAIERPIEQINELRTEDGSEPFAVEPALVEAVLEQVGRGETDAVGRVETTYLQLVMRRLWEVESAAGSRTLRLQTLRDLGGAQAIIATHLDRAMDDPGDGGVGLSADQRRIAAAIFHFLVTSGGTKIALTAEDLSDLSGVPGSELEPVLQHLSSPKLHILRPIAPRDGRGQPLYEIFHDALARPIVEWRTEVEDAERNARLESERDKREQAQQEAIEAERRAARERNRKRVALALLGLTVFVLVAGAIVVAITEGNLADKRQAAAESAELSGRLAELSSSPTFGPAPAVLASIEADRLSHSFEARNGTLAVLQTNAGLPKIAVGHTRAVETLAYWPGSDKLASGGDDGTVRLWKADGSQLGEHPFVIPGRRVLSVAVSRAIDGGRTLAAGTDAAPVQLWKVNGLGLKEIHTTIEKTRGEEVWAAAFDPTHPELLATGESGRVSLWDVKDLYDPVRLGTMAAPGTVYGLAFSADGRRLLVAAEGGREELTMSGGSFADLGPISLGDRAATSVAVAPNGAIAFGEGDGAELIEGGRHRHFAMPAEALSVAFAGDGAVLVAAGDDANVTTWDTASGRPFGPPRSHETFPVWSVAVSPDGRTIASAGGDGMVKLWPLSPKHAPASTVGGLDPREAALEATEPEAEGFEGLAVGGDGLVAASAGAAGTSIWRLDGPARESTAPQPLTRIPGRSYAVAFHGGMLAVGRGNSFVLVDTTCPTMPARVCRLGAPPRSFSAGPVDDLAIEEYGGRILLASTGFEDDVLNLWGIARTGETARITHLRSVPIGAQAGKLAFDRRWPLLAVAAQDGKARVWDVSDPEEPEEVHVEHAHGNENQPVEAVAFSPNGTLLASGGLDQQVVLWRVAREGRGFSVKRKPRTMIQTQSILSLAFSRDGTTLAAGDGDGSTCVYDLASRRGIGGHYCLPGHVTDSSSGGVSALDFTPRGDGDPRLLTTGTGQQIVAWDPILWDQGTGAADERKLTADACAIAGRNLSSPEWTEIFDTTQLADDTGRTCRRYPPR